MAIAFVGESAVAVQSVGVATASYSPATGNTLVVLVLQSSSSSRTYSITDDVGGSAGWTQTKKQTVGTAMVGIVFTKPNVPAGISSVTVTQSGGSVAGFEIVVNEYSGMGTTITLDASDFLTDASGNNHTASTSGVTSANDVVALVIARLSASATECAAGASWTETPNPQSSNINLRQRRLFGSGCTNEVGAWSNTGTARVGNSLIVLLSGNGGGPPPPPSGDVPMLADSIVVQLDTGAGWVTNNDVLINSVRWKRGIDGSGPRDRTAQTGFLWFDLRNDARNSAGLEGRYSPGHTNCLVGFTDGIPARLVITVDGFEYPQWTGRIATISPAPGKRGPRRTVVVCTDWMEEAANEDIRGLSLLSDATYVEALTALVGEVAQAPFSTSYLTGVSSFPFVFDQSSGNKVLSEIARLMQSEMGQCYVKKDGTVAGEGRNLRTVAVSQYTFTNHTGNFEAIRDRRGMVNRVKVTGHPRRIGAVAEVLYSHDVAIQIEPGATVTFDVPYRDPEQEASHVGARSTEAFTAGVDYVARNTENGGTDLTANIDTTGTFFGANAARFVLENTGGTVAYIQTGMQCRGYALKDYAPFTVTAEDTASQAAHGVNQIEIDLPFETAHEVVKGIAAWILYIENQGSLRVRRVEVKPNRDIEVLTQAVSLEISDRITIEEDVTGIALDYFINAVEGRLTGPRSFDMTWILAPADPQTYFIWNTSEWDDAGTLWGYA